MWLGNSTDPTTGLHFRGAIIARAVMEDLAARQFTNTSIPTPYGPGPNRTRLVDADAILVSGGAGIVAQMRQLRELVPSRPSANMTAVCDGCALLDLTPPSASASSLITDCGLAATCPPSMVLQKGFKAWQPPRALLSWKQVLAPASLEQLPVRCLVQQPQFDATQLRQYGAWPVTNATAAFVSRFGNAYRELMASRAAAGQ